MLRDPIVAVTVMMGMIIIMVMIIAMMHLYMTATTYAPVHSPLPTSLPLRYGQPSLVRYTKIILTRAPPKLLSSQVAR